MGASAVSHFQMTGRAYVAGWKQPIKKCNESGDDWLCDPFRPAPPERPNGGFFWGGEFSNEEESRLRWEPPQIETHDSMSDQRSAITTWIWLYRQGQFGSILPGLKRDALLT